MARPKLESFDTLEDYVEAIVDWKIRQIFRNADQEWLRLIGITTE